jgi:hypothetical protein
MVKYFSFEHTPCSVLGCYPNKGLPKTEQRGEVLMKIKAYVNDLQESLGAPKTRFRAQIYNWECANSGDFWGLLRAN